jgi:osmoprotectant transport system permease protein
MSRKSLRGWLLLALFTGIFIFLIWDMALWQTVLSFFFPNEPQVIYSRANLITLVVEHLQLVGVSSALTIIIGIPLGIWVTRANGQDFLSIVTAVTAFGQTFPPVAVLALAVPALGFGLLPTVVALFLYGLLPVVRNTITGIRSVPDDALEASYGMGMSRWQTLTQVETPLAAPLILAGVRISVIINVGTAMIGATIGAGGLGSPIIAGLVQNNVAYVVEGAVPAALLAVLIDQLFANIERSFIYSAKPA